jgi:hypothetical protein
VVAGVVGYALEPDVGVRLVSGDVTILMWLG